MNLSLEEIKIGNLPIEFEKIESYISDLENVLDHSYEKIIPKNTGKMNVPVVQFGKYRGKPASELMKDEQYLDWCNKQPDLIAKHQTIFDYIKKNSSDKSPEKVREELTVEKRIQKLEENIEYQRKKLKLMEDELNTIKVLLVKPENKPEEKKSSGKKEEKKKSLIYVDELVEDEEPEEASSTSMKAFLAQCGKK